VISGFRHVVAENYAFLGYYAASGGNFLPTSHFSLRKNPEERILSSGLSFTALNTGDVYGRTSGRNRPLLPEQWACYDMPLYKKLFAGTNKQYLTNVQRGPDTQRWKRWRGCQTAPLCGRSTFFFVNCTSEFGEPKTVYGAGIYNVRRSRCVCYLNMRRFS
jgi:hypothetical protein